MSVPCSLHCRSVSFLLRPWFCCWADRAVHSMPAVCQALCPVGNMWMHEQDEVGESSDLDLEAWGRTIEGQKREKCDLSCPAVSSQQSINHSGRQVPCPTELWKGGAPSFPTGFLYHCRNLAPRVWRAFCQLSFVHLFCGYHGEWRPPSYHSGYKRPVWHITVNCNRILGFHSTVSYESPQNTRFQSACRTLGGPLG